MNNLVLLIEDEEKTGSLLKKALESEKICVDWIKEGEKVSANMDKGKYELIILDLKLPKMSGDEILEEIRKIDPYVEVIVYTNYSEPPVMKKLINLGVDGYINKGPDADLWDTVQVVKRKLDPLAEAERENLLGSLPKDTFQIQ